MSFIILGFLGVAVNAQFEVQNSGTDKNLFQITFSNDKTAFVIGEEGTLLITLDGGIHWDVIDIDNENDFADIYFLNPDTGFIIGEHNTFLRTVDGGESWMKIEIPVVADLSSIKFVNKSIGYVAGHGVDGGIILRTKDAGLSWSCKVINENCKSLNKLTGVGCEDLYLLTMSFLNENEGILGGFLYNYKIGKRAFLCKTIDGGNTFTDISPDLGVENWSNGYEIVSLDYLTPHDAYAVLNTGRGKSFLFLSDYRIKTFEQLDNEKIHNYHELYFSSLFLDRSVGYFTCLIDGKSQILKTIDLGESFMFLNPPTNNTLYGSYFTDNNNGYFVGQNGTILHFTDNNNSANAYVYSDEEDLSDPPFSVAMPNNRFNRTQIYIYNVDVFDKNDVDVVLFDRNGSEIEVKGSNVKIYSDEIRMKIKTKSLALGTYFYSIKRNNQTLVNGKINIGSLAHLAY